MQTFSRSLIYSLIEGSVVIECGIEHPRCGRFKDGIFRHLPVHILVVHLELGQLPTVVNGDN